MTGKHRLFFYKKNAAVTVSTSIPLIRAKLYRPPVGQFYVDRPRLNEQLDRGLEGALTLVCAPAGFGKSTMISAWLDGLDAPLPSAWLSLDERDSDITVFTRYLIAALRTISPDACPETLRLLDAPELAPLPHIAALLDNEIAALPPRFVLVLDDYSNITDDRVHELLNELLRHAPPPMHLVLIARRDPPLRLTGLRARGLLAEVRTPGMRFTREEIAAYLRRALPQHTDPALLAQFEQVTEGWGAGLHLTALALRAAAPPEASLVARLSGDAHVTEYLFDEVFSLQPALIQSFLLRTAILDRYCASLASAVLGGDNPGCDAPACIEQIKRADLFIMSLDGRNEWHRYHHLFQSFLLERLAAECSPDQINALQARAASWFAARGLIDEALHHALVAGNHDLAIEVVERGLRNALNLEDAASFERWLSLFPEEIVSSRPGLQIVRAWKLQFSWQLAAQVVILDRVEAMLNSDAARPLTWEGGSDLRPLRGQIALMRAQQAYFASQPKRAMAFAEEALAHLPQSWVYARGAAVLYSALGRWSAGEGAGLAQSLLDRYESLADKMDTYALRHLLAVCFISVQAGQLERARQAAEAMLHQGQRSGSALIQNWARYFLGLVHLERDELTEADQHFSILTAHRYTTFMAALHDGFAGMALVHQARGDSAAAQQTVQALSEIDLERVGMEDVRTGALRARLQLRQGDVEPAGRWADAFTAPVPDQPILWMDTPHLTRARILIARNRGSDLPAALEILDAVFDVAERTHNATHMMRVLALRALALEMMGEREGAQIAMKDAVALARPGGLIRVFVDLGPPMQAMLRRLSRQGDETESIRRILNAFPDSGSTSVAPDASVERSPDRGNGSLVEPLTARELEILELLRGNLSDKEIARELIISLATVQRHTANIYGKLGVHRRSDAVAEAEALGLLPPR